MPLPVHLLRRTPGFLILLFASLCPAAPAQDAEPAQTVRYINWTPEGWLRCKAFVAGLKDSSRAVRGEVVRLMAEQLSLEACTSCGFDEKMLPEFLHPERPHAVRAAAARILGQMGEDGFCLPEVVRLLQDANWEIRALAVDALGRMEENYEFFAAELAKVGRDPRSDVRQAAAAAYLRLRKPLPAALRAEGARTSRPRPRPGAPR